MASSPAYAYVYGDELPRPPLLKVDVTNALSKLHSLYWNRKINQDELEWVGTRHSLPDIDESEIVRGCFTLTLDVKDFTTKTLWVRKDYLRIYDYCNSFYKTIREDRGNQRPPSAIITGQPGVGKTIWILYAVRRRLGEAEPFLWYSGMQRYLFVQGGVFEIPERFDPTLFAPYIWVFLDVNDTRSDLLAELTRLQSKLFIIFTTYPQSRQWKPLMKNTIPMTLVMNPWTWDEMNKAADIHLLTEDQRKRSREVFLEYGPIPRLCINFVKLPSLFSAYQIKLATAISDIKIRSLLRYVKWSENLDMRLSHFIILVKRESVDDLFKFTIEPISLSVNRQLKQQLMKKEQKEQLRTYLLHETSQRSRIVMGLIFESMAQFHLQQQADIDLVRMVREPGQRGGNAKWVSKRGSGASSGTRLSLKPIDVIDYKGNWPSSIKEDVFYVQSSPNQVAPDSFILIEQVLYIFQITIAASHPIKEGIVDFLSQSTLEKAKWYLVFIIPQGSSIFCSEANVEKMKEFWDKATLFTAEIDVHKLAQPQDGDSGNDDGDFSNNDDVDIVSNVSDQPVPSSSHQTRFSTRLAAQKREARAVSPINEATSSSRHKVP